MMKHDRFLGELCLQTLTQKNICIFFLGIPTFKCHSSQKTTYKIISKICN